MNIGTHEMVYKWTAVDVLWIEAVFILIGICIWLLLHLIRYKKTPYRKLVHVELTIVVFLIWYFYPTVFYEGTYAPPSREPCLEGYYNDAYISSDGTIMIDPRGIFKNSNIKPFQRVLWIDTFSHAG